MKVYLGCKGAAALAARLQDEESRRRAAETANLRAEQARLRPASDAAAAFEAQRTALIESAEPMGVFTALNVPDRFGPTWSQRQ